MAVSKKENKKKGNRGEALAARYLEKVKGHCIIERNYRCPCGEIDIISRCGTFLVFTEVKYRRTAVFGSPGQAVDWKKQNHIIRSAFWYLNAHHLENESVRFDIVELVEASGEKWIRHLEDAFQI